MITPSQQQAIIYIPGITRHRDQNKSIESFAYRIKKAIDINSTEGTSKYGVDIQKRNFGKDDKLECKVANIYKWNGDKKVGVYDIYELDYNNELTGKFQDQNVFLKTIWLFYALMSKFPRVLHVLVNSGIKGISIRDKVQAFLLGFILFCLSAYGLTLISALMAELGDKFYLINIPPITKIIEIPPVQVPDILIPAYNLLAFTADKLYSFFAIIILNMKNLIVAYREYVLSSAAAIFLLLPDFRNSVTNTATDYLCLVNYFNIGERRLTIIGKFEELLENVMERERKYEAINVYAYSFGSIIALDTLFPYDGRTSERIRTKVNSLVTIGCPYDFIRVYWPNYFANRKKSNIKLHSWYNIYSAVDILSSNFRNDAQEKDPEFAISEGTYPSNIVFNVISPQQMNFLSMLMLTGLRSHAMYWDDTECSASCFSSLFQEMKLRYIQSRRVLAEKEPEEEFIEE